MLHLMLTITMTAVAFWKNGSFTEGVPWEISDTRVDTKSKGIEVTCNVSCRMTLHMVML